MWQLTQTLVMDGKGGYARSGQEGTQARPSSGEGAAEPGEGEILLTSRFDRDGTSVASIANDADVSRAVRFR